MMTPTSTVKYVLLASFLNGHWIETTYEVSDRRWKDALKILRDLNTRVKLIYK